MSKKVKIYFAMLSATPYLALMPILMMFFGSDEVWQIFGGSVYNIILPVALFVTATGVLTPVCFLRQ